MESPHFIVGIGASAGGLEALEKFFAAMPERSGLSFVVVQHLSPDHRSFMVELLSKRTRIPVLRAEDGLEVKPDHIYLIPPKKNLKIFQSRLLLVEQDLARGFNLPIDVFFRSLAEEKQHQAIGVVLSGTGSDGTMGIRAIKDSGGMVMVQSEATAQFDGMPHSAISTGLADFILPPEEMPRQLMQYVKHPLVAHEQTIAHDQSATETLMHKVFALLRERCGVDFTHYKPSTIDRRIARRISIHQLNNLEEYYQYLESSPREANLLFNELLICVTRFFRDRESFEYLQQAVVPGILERVAAGSAVRVWVPSCSTGEEAYSVAMLFADEMERRGKNWDVKIFATDISKAAIESASLGLYSESEIADVPPEKLKAHFIKVPEGFQISRALRQMVVFARHDLLKDPPFTKLDFISCRNVLIYFQPELQARVIGRFHFALKSEGILFLGSSETLGEMADKFHTVNSRHKVYRARPGTRTRETQFALPSVERPEPFSPRLLNRGATGTERRVLETIFHDIVGDYAPPCVVVDEHGEVLHVLGKGGEYLKHPPGNFSNNLLKLTSSNVAAALATAMHRAERQGKEVTLDNVKVQEGGTTKLVRLRVKPVKVQDKSRTGLRLVFFEEKKLRPAKRNAAESPADTSAAQRITELEHELVYTKESLQATVEELETANEELQATNEELLASNEQLQSTNEELQSVNEELHTVNVENQNRIEELTELSNDINNLLVTSGVGTMLVDQTLHLRKISQAACSLAKLTPADVGAPLEVLGRTLQYPELGLLAEKVAQGGASVERVIHQSSGQCMLVRIMPYRTETHQSRGLVVTLIDITERKHREELIQGILDSTPGLVAVVNGEGDVVCINEAWKESSLVEGVIPGALELGDNYFERCRQASVGAMAREAWALLAGCKAVLTGRSPQFEMDYSNRASGQEPRWFRANVEPLPGKGRGLVIFHANISESKRLAAQSSPMAALFQSADDAIIGKNLDGWIVSWNTGAERLFGYTAAEAVGQSITMLLPPERQGEMEMILERIRKGEAIPRFESIRLTNAGRAIPVLISVTPIRNEEGGIVGALEIDHMTPAASESQPQKTA